jgi:hypothetical protein
MPMSPVSPSSLLSATVAYDRVKMIRKLREGDRKKDDFIALLANELRNPLAPIHIGLQVIRLAAGNPEALEEAGPCSAGWSWADRGGDDYPPTNGLPGDGATPPAARRGLLAHSDRCSQYDSDHNQRLIGTPLLMLVPFQRMSRGRVAKPICRWATVRRCGANSLVRDAYEHMRLPSRGVTVNLE